jgi:hypothetical protein
VLLFVAGESHLDHPEDAAKIIAIKQIGRDLELLLVARAGEVAQEEMLKPRETPKVRCFLGPSSGS